MRHAPAALLLALALTALGGCLAASENPVGSREASEDACGPPPAGAPAGASCVALPNPTPPDPDWVDREHKVVPVIRVTIDGPNPFRFTSPVSPVVPEDAVLDHEAREVRERHGRLIPHYRGSLLEIVERGTPANRTLVAFDETMWLSAGDGATSRPHGEPPYRIDADPTSARVTIRASPCAVSVDGKDVDHDWISGFFANATTAPEVRLHGDPGSSCPDASFRFEFLGAYARKPWT